MTFSEFRENPRFSRKSRIFAKIQYFLENLIFLQTKSNFWRKSRTFAKIILSSRIESKISDFRKNRTFSQKFRIFAKCWDFAKISDAPENPKSWVFEKKFGFLRKSQIFMQISMNFKSISQLTFRELDSKRWRYGYSQGTA